MLKGKRVLMADYFGTVLNDAEREPCVIIRVIRMRRSRRNGEIMQIAGLPPVETWWVPCDEMKAIPWGQVGEIALSPRLPQWLYLRALRRRQGGHSRTVIKSRSYIDW